MFQVTAVLSFSICAEPMLQVYVIHLSSVLGRKVTFYRKKLYFMGSTFIYWSLISLSAPWAAVCDPSSSSLPDVFVFHLLVQPALPLQGSISNPPRCGGDAAPRQQCCVGWLWSSHCTRVGAGRALWVVGGSKLGLGPQQRGPAAAWAAQKSRKVTIPLCSALIRPHQGTVPPFGSAQKLQAREGPRAAACTHPWRGCWDQVAWLFAGVHDGRARDKTHKWKPESQSWISGKTSLPGAGCQGRLCRLRPGRCQAPSGYSPEQPGLAWGWPSPEPDTVLETSWGAVQPELSCVPMIYVFICLSSAHLLSPIYRLLFSSHLFHFLFSINLL